MRIERSLQIKGVPSEKQRGAHPPPQGMYNPLGNKGEQRECTPLGNKEGTSPTGSVPPFVAGKSLFATHHEQLLADALRGNGLEDEGFVASLLGHLLPLCRELPETGAPLLRLDHLPRTTGRVSTPVRRLKKRTTGQKKLGLVATCWLTLQPLNELPLEHIPSGDSAR